MARMFGTDGVRGIANVELTSELAFKLGQAGARVLAKTSSGTPTVLIGKDTRISGDMLECALAAGICSVGANAVFAGVIPTPAIAYLTRKYKASAGVVISASHNPAKYNGIKFFSGTGFKLPDEVEDEIEALIESGVTDLPGGDAVGKITYATEAIADYADFAASTIDCTLDGLKIAVDCANGASYKVAPAVLERLGAKVTVISNQPNGININAKCGSTYLENVGEFVRGGDYDIGVAFDGDADRVLITDSQGNEIDGDKIMAALALQLKSEGKLKNNTLVATVMSNMGLFIMAEKNGINVLKTKVGDRYVLEEMMAGGHIIGGEQSGHIILSDHNTTGDGLVSALQFLSTMKKTGKSAAQLASVMEKLPQVLINVKVDNAKKAGLDGDEEIAARIKAAEDVLAGTGRVLIRPSGTEPKIRVMLEGSDKALIQKEAEAIAAIIKERLGE